MVRRSYRSFSLALGLVLSVAALSGCVTQMRGYSGVDNEGKREFLTYAAAQSPVLLEVKRAPFAGGDKLASAAAARFASGAVFAHPAQFTPDPALAKHPNYRLVIFANSFPTGSPDALCEGGADVPRKEEPGRIRLDGAFCAGDEPLSTAWTEGPAITNPEDPEFRTMVRGLVNELFPRERERERELAPKGLFF